MVTDFKIYKTYSESNKKIKNQRLKNEIWKIKDRKIYSISINCHKWEDISYDISSEIVTTSNAIVADDCGRLPPNTQCTMHALCYMNRVMHMNEGSLVKQVYHELRSLHDQGFNTWVTRMHKLADDCQMNLSPDPAKFHHNCKIVVRTNYIKQWEANMTDLDRNPILRTYRYIKWSFKVEPYLN